MSDLVRNPEDRFSRDAALIMLGVSYLKLSRDAALIMLGVSYIKLTVSNEKVVSKFLSAVS